MAKSQIIKDLANGTVDLHTSLKRAKVIFQEIGSEDSSRWIRNELEGYKDKEDVPEYRKVRGSLVGCYIYKASVQTDNTSYSRYKIESILMELLCYI